MLLHRHSWGNWYYVRRDGYAVDDPTLTQATLPHVRECRKGCQSNQVWTPYSAHIDTHEPSAVMGHLQMAFYDVDENFVWHPETFNGRQWGYNYHRIVAKLLDR